MKGWNEMKKKKGREFSRHQPMTSHPTCGGGEVRSFISQEHRNSRPIQHIQESPFEEGKRWDDSLDVLD